ncbi:hypothetical protein [Helicobacter bizzozeronii]|uniref:hypothetical protein n=1 Tax=Helicobacter bizzozeronii TaxID=56877 RepID=UPI000CF170D8|nr:hypothetical protein [Helicobacter bizzozeronii]
MDTIDNRLNMAGQDRGGQGSNKGGGDKQVNTKPTYQPDEKTDGKDGENKKKKPKELKDMTRRELSNLVGRLGKQITKAKFDLDRAKNSVETRQEKLDTLKEKQKRASQELIKRQEQDK